MITYPLLIKASTIGVTAPSSGLENTLHPLLHDALKRMESKGYNLIVGDTPWTQNKATSSSAKKRAEEFNTMMHNEDIHFIFPPWGGELLIEMVEFIDFKNIQPKWIIGYSDISILLLAMTLKTGIATAHGTNLIDLRGKFSDETTAMWENVLSTKKGDSNVQHSSKKYQKEWSIEHPTSVIFNLTESTFWQVVGDKSARLEGRLLGGCMDTIRHLIGTPFGDVQQFKEEFIQGDPIIWYLENSSLSTTDLRRSLVQMKYAGWFTHCAGIMFGRSAANHTVENYTVEDVYEELSKELQIPIIYDIDCGHVPPQITFINGAYAEVEVVNGHGTIRQTFK